MFAAIYHRFGFLSPSIDEVGIGTTQDKTDSKNSAFVYVMGNSEFNRVCSFETFRGSGSYNYGVCRDKAHKIDPKVYKEVLDVNKIQNPKIIVYPYDWTGREYLLLFTMKAQIRFLTMMSVVSPSVLSLMTTS